MCQVALEPKPEPEPEPEPEIETKNQIKDTFRCITLSSNSLIKRRTLAEAETTSWDIPERRNMCSGRSRRKLIRSRKKRDLLGTLISALGSEKQSAIKVRDNRYRYRDCAKCSDNWRQSPRFLRLDTCTDSSLITVHYRATISILPPQKNDSSSINSQPEIR